MGFLDDEEYSGTTDIDLGRGYWVRVRNCLPREKFKIAEKLLSSSSIHREQGEAQTIDASTFRDYMVKSSIVEWNLDDGEGENARIWPFNNDAAIARGVDRIPGKMFEKIFDVVNALNGERSKEETERFPEGHDLGDPAGETGTAGAVEAGAGALALAGARSEPAAVLRSAVA